MRRAGKRSKPPMRVVSPEPEAQKTPEPLEAQLESLATSAVRVVRDVLHAGEGNATALKAAQWVLTTVIEAQKEARQVTPGVTEDVAQRELEAVLRLVR